MNAPARKAKASFNWADPLLLDQQLTEDERMVREAAQAYCQEKLLPRVLEAFRNEKTDPAIFREMGAVGLLGSTIPAEYGVDGFWFRYKKHFVYWKRLADGRIGIVTLLHEKMFQIGRMRDDFVN